MLLETVEKIVIFTTKLKQFKKIYLLSFKLSNGYIVSVYSISDLMCHISNNEN